MELTLIAQIEGEELLAGTVGGIVAADDGVLYVSDVQRPSQSIIVINEDGERAGTIGGPGEGPGQFTGLDGRIAWWQGVLVVYDGRRRRVTTFSRQGEVEAEWRWQAAAFGSFLLSDGEVLVGREVEQRPLTQGPAPEPPDVAFVVFGEDGQRQPSPVSGRMEWPVTVSCIDLDGGLMDVLELPFVGWGRPAVAGGDALVMPRRDRYEIEFIALATGDTVGSIRRDVPPMEITDARWARQAEVARFRDLEEESLGRYADAFATDRDCPFETARPSHFPPIREVWVGDDGRVWVESPVAEGFEVAVFDRDGSLLGTTGMPRRDPSVRPYARGDTLYIVNTGELDVQFIEVYELVQEREGR